MSATQRQKPAKRHKRIFLSFSLQGFFPSDKKEVFMSFDSRDGMEWVRSVVDALIMWNQFLTWNDDNKLGINFSEKVFIAR